MLTKTFKVKVNLTAPNLSKHVDYLKLREGSFYCELPGFVTLTSLERSTRDALILSWCVSNQESSQCNTPTNHQEHQIFALVD